MAEASSSRRSKKSKQKRPRAPPSDDGGSSNELVIVDEDNSSGSTKMQPTKTPIIITKPASNLPGNNPKKRKKRDSASSDEERWLTAIESGKLEDVDDELKKIKPKDPALMTARQRAMYDRSSEPNPTIPTLMSLPTGYKEKVMTAEAIQKAQIKSLKRKQLADEKREKDKKKTMERLLKKQDSKAAKQAKAKIAKSSAPCIVYRQSCEVTRLTIPEGYEFPLERQVAAEPKKVVLCGMGCGNIKKYSCSRTGVPLCSLACYKNNISSRIL